jgi:transposase
VRLLAAQDVKPDVKTNKSDDIDAEAIAEKIGRPRMPFVPIKRVTIDSICSVHRVRERWMMRRTAVINQSRGLLASRWRLAEGNRFHLLFQN